MEPELSIQSFHQCHTFISIKLNTTNFLLWQNQIIVLAHGLDVLYHLLNGEKHIKEIKDDKRNKNSNSQHQLWINNDKLLTSWLLGTMKLRCFKYNI